MSSGFMNPSGNGGGPPLSSSSSGPGSQQAPSVTSVDQEMEGVQTISSPVDANPMMFAAVNSAAVDMMGGQHPMDPIMSQMHQQQQQQQPINQYSIEHPMGNYSRFVNLLIHLNLP